MLVKLVFHSRVAFFDGFRQSSVTCCQLDAGLPVEMLHVAPKHWRYKAVDERVDDRVDSEQSCHLFRNGQAVVLQEKRRPAHNEHRSDDKHH